MKMSYRSVQYEYSAPTIEVTEGEIAGKYRGRSWKYHYPKHICRWESASHRQPGALFHENLAKPKTCKNVVNESEALNILKYQLKDDQAKKAHLENVRRNLERRLQTAKANGDQRLVDLLTQESCQLEMSEI